MSLLSGAEEGAASHGRISVVFWCSGVSVFFFLSLSLSLSFFVCLFGGGWLSPVFYVVMLVWLGNVK
jgi:hypothetical protein